MRVVHIQNSIPEKVNRPTAKQIYHEKMVAAVRRRRYVDFLRAGENEAVQAAEALAKTVSPDYQPKFNK